MATNPRRRFNGPSTKRCLCCNGAIMPDVNTTNDSSENTSTSPDFIPDSEFVPDQPAATQSSNQQAPGTTPDFIPNDQFVPDQAPNTNDSISHQPDFIPNDQFVADADKYGTTGEKILAGAERVGQGFAGPIPTLMEQGLSKIGVPGLTDNDIKGREAALNPLAAAALETAGSVASFALPFGPAALVGQGISKVAKLAQLAEATSVTAKLGVSALQGAIQTGMIQGGDNVTKALLGQGDPSEPVGASLANGIGAASLL